MSRSLAQRAPGETLGGLVLVETGSWSARIQLEIATALEVARRGAVALDNTRVGACQDGSG